MGTHWLQPDFVEAGHIVVAGRACVLNQLHLECDICFRGSCASQLLFAGIPSRLT